MDADRTGWLPLPDIGDTDRAERAGVHRDSIGRARRVSNWTAVLRAPRRPLPASGRNEDAVLAPIPQLRRLVPRAA